MTTPKPVKRIAALTMARNDHFFLSRWIDYYGRELGYENLYVFLDGLDQEPPANSEGVHVVKLPKEHCHVVKDDKRRIDILSSEAAKLFDRYDLVIGTDADEFLLVDPRQATSLASYLSQLTINNSCSALGLDVGQHLNYEEAIDAIRPILSQRSYAVLSPRYSKSVILARPLSWGSGFHRVRGHNFHIDPHLYLVHLGGADLKMLEDRFTDDDRMAAGWERHLRKRARTIYRVSEKQLHRSFKFIRLMRTLQNLCRPIFAWNKPTLYGYNPVVQLPDFLTEQPKV